MEQEVIVDEQDGAAGDGSGEGTPADEGAADVQVDVDEGEGDAAGDVEAPAAGEAKPEVNEWDGMAWRHQQAAQRLGMDAKTAKAVGASAMEVHAKALDAQANFYARMGQREGRASAPVKGQEAAAAATPPPGAPKQDAQAPAAFKLDVEGFDADFIAKYATPIEKQINAMMEQFGPMKQMADQFQQMQQQATVQRATEMTHDFCKSAEVQAHFRQVYGGTDAAKLNPVQVQARETLRDLADVIFTNAHNSGNQVSPTDAFRMALAATHTDEIKEVARQETAEQLAKRRAQMTPRASGRTAPEPKGDQKAVGFIKGFFAKRGQ